MRREGLELENEAGLVRHRSARLLFDKLHDQVRPTS